MLPSEWRREYLHSAIYLNAKRDFFHLIFSKRLSQIGTLMLK